MSRFLSFLIFTTVLSTTAALAAKFDKSVDIIVGGETRSYWLYVPSNVKRTAPLVVSLHGASGYSTDRSPFRPDIADKAGCIVVYPQGLPQYFPVFGGTVNGWDATGEDNADADFIRAIIEDVGAKYTIDRQRIYCCGFSNGGMMTYAFSNVMSDVFAAFASISGFPLNEFHFRHTGYRPVPFLHIHGKQDDFVRYALMPTIVDEMVARLGACPVPEKKTVTGKYDKSTYAAAEGSFPYIYYEVDGMGHNDFTDRTEDGNSAQTMWNFFKQYTLDAPCDTTMKWMPRIETEDFVPKKHGWTVNSGTTLLRFGGEQNTEGKQNVYHSLQLTTGWYKLCFRTEGDTDKQVTVKVQKLTGKKNLVLNTSVAVGGTAALLFEVTDGWGEYRFQISRPSSTDVITVTDITLHTATDDEVTAVRDLPNAQTQHSKPSTLHLFDLAGRQLINRRSAQSDASHLEKLPCGLHILSDGNGHARKVIIK